MSVNLADYEQGRPFNGDYDKALVQLQKRLAHLLVAYIVYRRKAIILFEGPDSSGKKRYYPAIGDRMGPAPFQSMAYRCSD